MIAAMALGESKPYSFVGTGQQHCTDFLRNGQSYSVEGSIIIIFPGSYLKVYNSQTSEFNLMNDEINYSTQITSKKHAVNQTTKFFASRRLEAAVAYGCNQSVNTIFAAPKTRVRFPPMVNFSCCFFF